MGVEKWINRPYLNQPFHFLKITTVSSQEPLHKEVIKYLSEISLRSRANEIQEDWKPTFLTNEEFTHLVLEAVDGFIIVFSASGRIFYASEGVTSLLGHLPVRMVFSIIAAYPIFNTFQSDVLNMTIYEMASEDEQTNLYNTLVNTSEGKGQISFSCHLKRGDPDCKQSNTYELVHFVGYFRKFSKSLIF